MRFVCWHAQEVHCPFFISRPAAPEEEIELEGGLKLWKRWVKVNSFIMIIMTFWVVSFQTCVNFMYFHPYVGRWSRFDPFWRILFQVGLKPPTSIGWLVDLPECILSALDDDNQVHWTFAFFCNARINALILQDSNEISDSRTWRYLTFDHTIAIHSQFVNWHETFPLHGVVSMVSLLQKQFLFACLTCLWNSHPW